MHDSQSDTSPAPPTASPAQAVTMVLGRSPGMPDPAIVTAAATILCSQVALDYAAAELRVEARRYLMWCFSLRPSKEDPA